MIREPIHVEYWRKPVPSAAFDYAAYFDNYDGAPDTPASARPVGYGATAYDAIVALLMECEE